MAEFGVIPRTSRVAGKGEESQRMRKRQRKRLPQQESDFPCYRRVRESKRFLPLRFSAPTPENLKDRQLRTDAWPETCQADTR